MDSLELVRKLYEDGTDLDALGKELDERSREELRQLIEARDALSGLPRRKPPGAVLDAVVEKAVRDRRERRPALTLLFAGRTLQRLAAAAVVVVAVGVGYLALRTDSMLPLEQDKTAAVSPEAPAVSEGGTLARKEELAEEVAPLQTDAASEAEPLQGRAPRAAFRQKAANGLASGEDVAAAAPPGNEMAPAEAEETVLDSVTGAKDNSRELLTWDDEEEALRTLFWQVRALDGRSPDDKWEEAVPLEGSFERLEKQQPKSDRWLETGTQR